MEARRPLVHLTTVVGSFHGRVVVARLQSEGVAAELRGSSEGPYPLPAEVEVFVPAAELDVAREILLADAVEAAFDEMGPDGSPSGTVSRLARRRLRRREGR